MNEFVWNVWKFLLTNMNVVSYAIQGVSYSLYALEERHKKFNMVYKSLRMCIFSSQD